MKKIIPFPASGTPLREVFQAGAEPTKEEFEEAATAFLNKRLPAASFLQICNSAIRAAEGDRSQKAVYKYKYLACMALERYYEAFLLSFVLLNRFLDEILHCEMMCSVCLKRNQYFTAMDYINRLISLYEHSNKDTKELQRDKRSLQYQINKISRFSAAHFSQIVSSNREMARDKLTGIPLLLTGPAHFLLHPDTGTPYFIFPAQEEGGRDIYCQAQTSEVPFLPRLQAGRTISVLGYFLGADEKRVLIQPSNYCSAPPR